MLGSGSKSKLPISHRTARGKQVTALQGAMVLSLVVFCRSGVCIRDSWRCDLMAYRDATTWYTEEPLYFSLYFLRLRPPSSVPGAHLPFSYPSLQEASIAQTFIFPQTQSFLKQPSASHAASKPPTHPNHLCVSILSALSSISTFL